MDGSTSFAIECPDCGEYTEKVLAWLKSAQLVDCAFCGAAIDINNEQYRPQIDSLLEQLGRSGY